MKKIISFVLSLAVVAGFAGCSSKTDLTGVEKPASEYTQSLNSQMYSIADPDDAREAEFALKGLIDAPESLELKDSDGRVIWSQKAYDFLSEYEKSSDTVNPSLRQNAIGNHAYGLFEVCDGIYQVRGYDMSNLTVIQGEKGWIVVDTLGSVECTRAAMQLIEKNLGKKDVKAVIISHPHVNHFGGIKGVINEEQVADGSLSLTEQVKSGKIPVIVPEGFAHHAMSENVYVGNAVSRRNEYQYGFDIEPSLSGKVGMGIGMGQSTGTVSFIAPTYEIKPDEEKITFDGVEFEFHITPGTEAPVEMSMWLPQKKALWLAENCAATLHNLYTSGGSPVRDGSEWAKYITEAVRLYGRDAEVVFQSHSRPQWGNDVILRYMEDTAVVYKFINDQTLTYINQGYTSDEISNMIELPESLAKNLYTRQYCGTVAHIAKAVYQKYMGWYDANPVNLNPLTPSESAKKWVEYLGDVDEVLEKAKKDYAEGEYRWVAEITNVIVYADPQNKTARYLCADALEQLGYQSESGACRNAYLSAANELRNGTNSEEVIIGNGDMLQNMTADMIFDFMGIRLDKKNLENEDFTVNFVLPDIGMNYIVHFKYGVMLVYKDELSQSADVTLTCPGNALLLMLQNNYDEAVQSIAIDGDRRCFDLVIDNLNTSGIGERQRFNIIEP